MTVRVQRVALLVRTEQQRHDVVEHALRELRQTLSAALEHAVGAAQADGIVLIPHLRVTMSASLGRVSGRDLARTIAQACINAAATGCSGIDGFVNADPQESRGERILRLLASEPGIRCSKEDEAAAWLIDAMNRRQTAMCRLSSFADLAGHSLGAAFMEISSRLINATQLVKALGRRAALQLAARCSDTQALCVLRSLNDREQPDAAAWAFAARKLFAAHSLSDTLGVRALSAAIDGIFMDLPGVASAVRTIASAGPERAAYVHERETALASNLTGLWLLFPFIAKHNGQVRGHAARATALALARYLGGSQAEDDPAVAALCTEGESLHDLSASIPADLHVDRMAAATIRDFARTLGRLGRARCGYILRAILSGRGAVRRMQGGWSATLPHSPLRVVLQRASLLGEIDVPWDVPRLVMERDDD